MLQTGLLAGFRYANLLICVHYLLIPVTPYLPYRLGMNMKKISIDVWIQLLGMVGIIASLISVGLEMRQTQRIAIAGQQQARASANMDLLNAFIESGFDH